MTFMEVEQHNMGEKRTQANIAERFYWRTITEDVKEFVSVYY